jgi:hypothetical protein
MNDRAFDNPRPHHDVNTAPSVDDIPLERMDFLVNSGHTASYATHLKGDVVTLWNAPVKAGGIPAMHSVLHIDRVLTSDAFQTDLSERATLFDLLWNEGGQGTDVRGYKEVLDNTRERGRPDMLETTLQIFRASYEQKARRMQLVDIILRAAETNNFTDMTDIRSKRNPEVNQFEAMKHRVNEFLRSERGDDGLRIPKTFEEALQDLPGE